MTAFRTLGVSYPLIALMLTGSPMAAGWVGFASTVPGLLLYIPAGALIDRFNPRQIMLCTEAVRGGAAASVFVTLLCGTASLSQLVVAAAVEGSLWVLHSLAETALIPSLVSRDRLPRALARSEMSFHTAVLAGRPLGGFLLGIGQAVPSAVNAVLFSLSFGFLLRMNTGDIRQDTRPRPSFKVGDGLREVARQPFLRAAMGLTALTNLMVNALTMVFLAGSAELSPLTVGLVLAGGGAGGALGSFLVLRLTPPPYMLFLQVWVWAVAFSIAAIGHHPAFFAVATLVTGCTGALSNITIRTFEAREIGPDKIARVASVSRLTSRTAISVAAPLGAFLVICFGNEGATMALFLTMIMVATVVTTVPSLRDNLIGRRETVPAPEPSLRAAGSADRPPRPGGRGSPETSPILPAVPDLPPIRRHASEP